MKPLKRYSFVCLFNATSDLPPDHRKLESIISSCRAYCITRRKSWVEGSLEDGSSVLSAHVVFVRPFLRSCFFRLLGTCSVQRGPRAGCVSCPLGGNYRCACIWQAVFSTEGWGYNACLAFAEDPSHSEGRTWLRFTMPNRCNSSLNGLKSTCRPYHAQRCMVVVLLFYRPKQLGVFLQVSQLLLIRNNQKRRVGMKLEMK